MDTEKIQKKMKIMRIGIYTNGSIGSLVILMLFLGWHIFFSREYEAIEFHYTLLAILTVALLIISVWPRSFDKRELELYDKYLNDQKDLKKQIKKEQFEEKIKKLEEKKSQI